jgi:hypothetical protein
MTSQGHGHRAFLIYLTTEVGVHEAEVYRASGAGTFTKLSASYKNSMSLSARKIRDSLKNKKKSFLDYGRSQGIRLISARYK